MIEIRNTIGNVVAMNPANSLDDRKKSQPGIRDCCLAIADDHPVFRLGIVQALVQSGFVSVFEASNGWELLTILSSQRVDVVLLDYRMPVLDGYETAERILTEYPSTKVILVSMYTEPALISNFFKLGIHGFLNKNASIEHVLDAIKTVQEDGFYRKGGTPIDFKNMPTLRLSTDERRLIVLLSEGLSSESIGRQLNVNVRTVENQRARLQQKLRVKNTTQLVDLVHRLGLL